MSDEYDVFAVEEKVAPKPKVKAEPEDPKRPENLTEEQLAALRRDIRRMWYPEPEETR